MASILASVLAGIAVTLLIEFGSLRARSACHLDFFEPVVVFYSQASHTDLICSTIIGNVLRN